MSLFRFLKALVLEAGSWVYALFVTAEPEGHPDASKDAQ